MNSVSATATSTTTTALVSSHSMFSLFGDDTTRVQLLAWSQFSMLPDNGACAAISCMVAYSLLASSPGQVLRYSPAGHSEGVFAIDEALLKRCVREATSWWQQLCARGGVLAEPGVTNATYIMPLQCLRDHPLFVGALQAEERWGMFDPRLIGLDASAGVLADTGLITLGKLAVELTQRSSKRPIAAVLTCSSSTSCVFVEPVHSRPSDRNYWFFDSHSNDRDGRRVSGGTAIVMRFGSMLEFVKYLQCLMGGGVDVGGATEAAEEELPPAHSMLDESGLRRLYGKHNSGVGEQSIVPSAQFDAVILTLK